VSLQLEPDIILQNKTAIYSFNLREKRVHFHLFFFDEIFTKLFGIINESKTYKKVIEKLNLKKDLQIDTKSLSQQPPFSGIVDGIKIMDLFF
jgi:hypothetical protein